MRQIDYYSNIIKYNLMRFIFNYKKEKDFEMILEDKEENIFMKF